MSGQFKKVAFLFPGQGAQYPGMGKDFFDTFETAKKTFEEADDILKRKLSTIIFEGPDALLTETINSQLGIYVVSVAIWRVISELYPDLKPSVCSGLSLGEYTALTASGRLSFHEGLKLVSERGQFMNDACEAVKGTMAVVLGLSADAAIEVVKDVNMPNDLWAANFNCPGQVVLSGTLQGIEAGSIAAKAAGAKRVITLQVHGAFHSGLMDLAGHNLAPYIQKATLTDSPCGIVMNVPGSSVHELSEVRKNLIDQVTHSVKWEQGVRAMMEMNVDLYVEMGCGTVLAGFNKKIGALAPCVSIETTGDIKSLDDILKTKASSEG